MSSGGGDCHILRDEWACTCEERPGKECCATNERERGFFESEADRRSQARSVNHGHRRRHSSRKREPGSGAESPVCTEDYSACDSIGVCVQGDGVGDSQKIRSCSRHMLEEGGVDDTN